MRPPPALALAALCLLALPAAAAAAYFGSVPAAPPARLPSPPPATAGPTFPPSAPATAGSRTQTLALAASSPTSRSEFASPAPSLASQAQTPITPSSVQLSGLLPCRSSHPSLSETSSNSPRPISDPGPSSRTLHASWTLAQSTLARSVLACPGVPPALRCPLHDPHSAPCLPPITGSV